MRLLSPVWSSDVLQATGQLFYCVSQSLCWAISWFYNRQIDMTTILIFSWKKGKIIYQLLKTVEKIKRNESDSKSYSCSCCKWPLIFVWRETVHGDTFKDGGILLLPGSSQTQLSAGGLLSKLRSETIPLWACWCFEPLWGVFTLKPEQQQCTILVQVIQQTDTTDCQSNSRFVAWVPFRYYELKPWFFVEKSRTLISEGVCFE